ncbi:MAG: type I-C CRISPR-associated protein Cas5 [Deltaproteobacteria bacterium HGW-Deltaproteobacteria-9]|nr:MAG: type I-C CRISPR-associated protein Cas5 [Deltaproteobacteria bacterium HGW-Deltaproteobacteria-9]
MEQRDQALDVWGELACFTRPEFKVERFSYPVITPSAARGIYDAIYCKPIEFRWQITQIEVLSPPAYIALRRNEVKDKVSVNAVASWIRGAEPKPIIADGTLEMLGTDVKGRTQRQTMALRDVRYRLHAEIRPWRGFENRFQAFEAQFKRRALNGKCIYQPYLGCREFPAYFELVEPDTPDVSPASVDIEIGLMLYDVFDLSRPGTSTDAPHISIFKACVKQGILEVPPYEDDSRVLKRERGSTVD